MIFGDSFNKPINIVVLQKNLSKLIFGRCFNQPIYEYTLPQNLTEHEFGYEFDQELLPGVLPENLSELEFGYKFDQELLPEVLPENLSKLWIGNYRKNLSKGILPIKLSYMAIDFCDMLIQKMIFPKNLKKLYLGRRYGEINNRKFLPENLEHLGFNVFYDAPLYKRYTTKKSNCS